jgi:hypothetical protein
VLYFTMSLVSRAVESLVRYFVNDELERIRKEAVVV